MYTNNLEQLLDFFYFMITGMILGIVFDIFRILRRSFKTSDFITNIEDIIFGLISSVIIILSIYFINNGQLRFFIALGMALGMIFYLLYFSKYFIQLNVFIITCIKKIILIIIKPFVFLLKSLRIKCLKPFSFIIINIKLFIKKLFLKTTKKSKKTVYKEGF